MGAAPVRSMESPTPISHHPLGEDGTSGLPWATATCVGYYPCCYPEVAGILTDSPKCLVLLARSEGSNPRPSDCNSTAPSASLFAMISTA